MGCGDSSPLDDHPGLTADMRQGDPPCHAGAFGDVENATIADATRTNWSASQLFVEANEMTELNEAHSKNPRFVAGASSGKSSSGTSSQGPEFHQGFFNTCAFFSLAESFETAASSLPDFEGRLLMHGSLPQILQSLKLKNRNNELVAEKGTDLKTLIDDINKQDLVYMGHHNLAMTVFGHREPSPCEVKFHIEIAGAPGSLKFASNWGRMAVNSQCFHQGGRKADDACEYRLRSFLEESLRMDLMRKQSSDDPQMQAILKQLAKAEDDVGKAMDNVNDLRRQRKQPAIPWGGPFGKAKSAFPAAADGVLTTKDLRGIIICARIQAESDSEDADLKHFMCAQKVTDQSEYICLNSASAQPEMVPSSSYPEIVHTYHITLQHLRLRFTPTDHFRTYDALKYVSKLEGATERTLREIGESSKALMDCLHKARDAGLRPSDLFGEGFSAAELEEARFDVMSDVHAVRQMVKEDPHKFKEAPAELHKDPTLVLTVVEKDWTALQSAGCDCINLAGDKYKEKVMHAVERDGHQLEFAAEVMTRDRQVVMAAVNQKGVALQHACADLKGDRQVVLAAVAQDGMALEFVNERLQADIEIVTAAVQQNGFAVMHAAADAMQSNEVLTIANEQMSQMMSQNKNMAVLYSKQVYGTRDVQAADATVRKKADEAFQMVKEHKRFTKLKTLMPVFKQIGELDQ